MNRELIVTLLQKQIEELRLMTEGFMDMTHYPEAMIRLAMLKNSDIAEYLQKLGELKEEEEIVIVEEEEIKEEEILIEEIEEEVINQEEPEIIEETTEPEAVEVVEETTEPDEVEVIEETIEPEEVEITAETTVSEEVEIIENEVENIEEAVEIVEEETEEESNEEEEQTEEDELEVEIEEKEEIIIITPEPELVSKPGLTRNEAVAADLSLNSSIGNKKITDIRQAISIGDRFRFQRELFRNNGEDMNKTLIYINQLASFEEVFSFLQSKYSWDKENTNAEDFYQIVKRKF